MTSAVNTAPRFTSRLINGVLAIKPLAKLAKHQARQMIIKRAEKIGVPWTKEVQALRERDWEADLTEVQNLELTYPEYYLRPFHAYDNGNLNWEAAWELECAAYAVHAHIWPGAGAQGDAKLRQSYHDILKAQVASQPQYILDLGCSVGLSTFALQAVYPQAQVTGLDLSPYFLAVAHHKSDGKAKIHSVSARKNSIKWINAAAESTGLPDASFDLVSMFLVCHELPQSATMQIFHEARRLLRPGGQLAIMDMNPQSDIYAKMPPYILTLLKSTEPYLDEYFTLDIEQAIEEAGFTAPTIIANSPRHRTVIAQVIR